ncbi:MAG TPA: GAF domain-containing protein [Vicinamibacterales bacterium]|nr:GAF domain-containing protein [Vicinamibacterales bacterium]
MKQRRLGLLLTLTLLLALGTIVQDFRFDQAFANDHDVAVKIDREVGELEVQLSDLRMAQTGYLAAGQNPDFWIERTTELSKRLRESIDRLRAAAPNAEARAKYDAAGAALTDLMAIDKRARDLVKNDQRLLAADVVLVDELDPSQRLAGEISAVRDVEVAAANAKIASAARLRFGMNSLALGFVLVVLLFVSRATREPAAASIAPASTAQMIRDLPPPVKVAVPTPTPAAAARITAPAPPSPQLLEAAELCVDLARVIDGRDVPALVERTATVLDAKGVIIWVADADGRELRPTLTHGYSDKVIDRLGTLPIESDNVTSLAYRSMRPQAMNGGGPGTSGAVAVPLMTASGCVGVLAAEVRHSKPAAEMISLAKIIGAQFSSIVMPADAAEARSAANG